MLKVSNVSYHENLNAPKEWVLKSASFGSANLIVGSNSSGKTRTLNVVNGLARLISGRQKPIYASGNYDITFDDDKNVYRYVLKISNRTVTQETVYKNKKIVLDRKQDGKAYFLTKTKKQSLHISEDQLALSLIDMAFKNHDAAPIMEWSKRVRHYLFGSHLSKDELAIILDNEKSKLNKNPTQEFDYSKIIGLIRDGIKKYKTRFKKEILKNMNLLNYKIDDVGIEYLSPDEIQGAPALPSAVYVKERELKCRTRQLEMSSGMFRAFFICSQLAYWRLKGETQLLLIDDIGEGLDFERATKLVEIVLQEAENAGHQVLMTTNDRHVMNHVPVKYWTVIFRTAHSVSTINYRNSKEVFDKFRSMGLNNFDFISRNIWRKALQH